MTRRRARVPVPVPRVPVWTLACVNSLGRECAAAVPDVALPALAPQLARLNCISDLLSRVKYTEIPQEHLSLPPRDSDVPEGQRNYRHPPLSEWNIVPQIYTKRDLLLNDIVGYESHEARPLARSPGNMRCGCALLDKR